MQQGVLPIGVAVKMSSRWTYHITVDKLSEYMGKDVSKELEKYRKKNKGK
jgi:hypothetical protein